MPFRRRARILNELIKKLTQEKKPLELMHIVAAIELLVERIYAASKVLLFCTVAFLILLIGFEIQLQNRNSTISELRTTVNKLSDTVNTATDPANPGNRASGDAIERIKRIEYKVCGGDCPPLPSK